MFVFVCASLLFLSIDFIKGQYSIELPWLFILNGERVRVFVRHPLNSRVQHDTRRRYVALIKRHGIKTGKRSQPIAVPNHAVPGQYFLLAGATLAEAFYEALHLCVALSCGVVVVAAVVGVLLLLLLLYLI